MLFAAPPEALFLSANSGMKPLYKLLIEIPQKENVL